MLIDLLLQRAILKTQCDRAAEAYTVGTKANKISGQIKCIEMIDLSLDQPRVVLYLHSRSSVLGPLSSVNSLVNVF
jgi:hypothetical protein